jgi:hypothetical protein
MKLVIEFIKALYVLLFIPIVAIFEIDPFIAFLGALLMASILGGELRRIKNKIRKKYYR